MNQASTAEIDWQVDFERDRDRFTVTAVIASPTMSGYRAVRRYIPALEATYCLCKGTRLFQYLVWMQEDLLGV